MAAPSFRRRFACALIALSFLAVMTRASAVQTQHSVVVTDDPADWTPNILDGQVNADPPDGDEGHRRRRVHTGPARAGSPRPSRATTSSRST